MATAPTITMKLDVELSHHARALIEGDLRRRTTHARQFTPDQIADVFNLAVEEILPPTPGALLTRWLEVDAAALQAAASIAGDGARCIADEKLTRLEQLTELVAAQERRLAAYESDVVALAEYARTEAERGTSERAAARLQLQRIADIAHEHTLDSNLLAALGRLELASSEHRGKALLQILELAQVAAPEPFTTESLERYIAQGLGDAARQDLARSRSAVEDEGE